MRHRKPTMSRQWTRWLLASLLASAPCAWAAEAGAADVGGLVVTGQVYTGILEVLAAQTNRLPGSTGSEAALAALETRLRAAGVATGRQTYETVVPRTHHCRLTVAGRAVTPVHPCENGVAPFMTDGPWEGPVVFAGSGRLEDLDGLDLRGALVVIDLDRSRPTVAEVFMHGARAAILTGGDSLSQWNLGDVLADGPALVPRVFVPRAAAEAAGLLRNGATPPAGVLDVRVTLEKAEAANLWAILPGRAGAVGRLGGEEALVLSAQLATYGLVPDANPSLRRAANCALLADVVCALAAAPEPRQRTVAAVWFGSFYGNQEGARFFYHAVGQAEAAEGQRLDARLQALREERAELGELLGVADRPDLFAVRDETARRFTREVRQLLAARVNEANADLRDLNVRQAALASPDPGLAAAIARIEALKADWNVLRLLILKRRGDPPPGIREAYREAVGTVAEQFARRAAEVERESRHTQSWLALGRRLAGRDLVAHLDFDFGNARDPWTFSMIHASAAQRADLKPGHYLLHLDRLGRLHGSIADPGWGAPLFPGAVNPFYKPFSLSMPRIQTAPSSVGLMLGVAGFQLVTVGDPQAADPLPVRAPADLAPLAPQLAAFADALAESPALSLRRVALPVRPGTRVTYAHQARGTYRGTLFVELARGSSEESGPATRGLLTILSGWSPPALCGDSAMPRGAFNGRGLLTMPMIAETVVNYGQAYAYGFDDTGRLVRYGGGRGGTLADMRVPLFHGYGGMAFSWGYAPDPVGGALYQSRTLTARTDAVPQKLLALHASGGRYHFYTDRPEAVKRIGGNGDLLLNATPARPLGEGVPLDARALLNLDGIAQGADDGWRLNESRLQALRRRNIVNDGLERLHAEARDHLDRRDLARAGRRHAVARAHAVAATCLSNRVYGPLRHISDDLVQAVVVLLLLSIPFAFALERLLFGFTSIYLQVLAFAGFFLSTFLLLFFTHPAFALADAPAVIFLAFVIILLSAIVLAIVMSKIRQEIRAVQGLGSTVHRADSAANTALAAVVIGIAGMRNRPLKTGLTAVTVVLLTFTILVFASFGSRYGVVEAFLGRGSGEDRIELRRHSHLHLDDSLAASLVQLYGDRCEIYRRGGMFRNPVRGSPDLEADRILHCPRTGRTAGVGAFWGVERGEIARNPRLGELLAALGAPGAAAGDPPLLLPGAIADALAAEPGDTLLYGGARFRFADRFDALQVQALSAIDNSRVLPPDFTQTLQTLNIAGDGNTLQSLLEQTEAGSFEWFTGENVAIADYTDLERLLPGQPFVNALVLYPRAPDTDLMALAREIAPAFQGAVHVKGAGGAYRLHFTQVVAGSGFGDVIVPLLLGGLIIFSSLMGSIIDRQREIFTYSALGLSPPDIGMLFFAESSVYAVLGGMGGYLLGQVTAKLVNVLGAHGLIDAPEMNFASLGSVMTLLVVMALVGLSTIYPAIRASRAANPGVARSWRMPSPVGDRLDFVYPFTVSETDFAGILSFIREHFENHADATVGNFAAREVRLFREPATGGGTVTGITAEISLAPFDLGIFQRFRLHSRPFDIPGIGEVVVAIERISGSPAAWIRGNRKFAAELRHQFLLWRSLPVATIEHYRRQTAGTWEEPA